MPNDNDELNKKVDKLEKEIEDLKKKLDENTAKDKKHHEELKTLQQQNHKENLTWNKMGAIITPLAVALVPILIKLFESRQDVKPAIKKDADDINAKMNEIIKAIKE